MDLTQEEGLLHLSRWRDDRREIHAQFVSLARRYDLHVPRCRIKDVSPALELVGADGGDFAGTFDLTDAAWVYLEMGEVPASDRLQYLGLEPECPIVGISAGDNLLLLISLSPITVD